MPGLDAVGGELGRQAGDGQRLLVEERDPGRRRWTSPIRTPAARRPPRGQPTGRAQIVERQPGPLPRPRPTRGGRRPGNPGPHPVRGLAAGVAGRVGRRGARPTRRPFDGWAAGGVGGAGGAAWPTGPEAVVPLVAPLAPGPATGRAVDGTAGWPGSARWAPSRRRTAGTAAAGVAAEPAVARAGARWRADAVSMPGSSRRRRPRRRRPRRRRDPAATRTAGSAAVSLGRRSAVGSRPAAGATEAVAAGRPAGVPPSASSSSSRSLITLSGRKCSRCWRSTQRRRSTSCS